MKEEKQNIGAVSQKSKYKIHYGKLGALILGVVLVISLLVFGGYWLVSKIGGGERQVYDALVQLKDEKNKDPEEDAKNSAKAGDVILVRETGKEWSNTEKISYLILKIELNEEQANKIVQAKSKKLSKKEAIKEGIISKEAIKEMDREELKMVLKKDVLFREYRIKIEELEFDPMKVRNAQPFPDEVFDWGIVERK